MPNHFTPLGNHDKKETMNDNAMALSINIDERAEGVLKRKQQETYIKHLKRICKMKNVSSLKSGNVSRTSIERACLFLAIYELSTAKEM